MAMTAIGLKTLRLKIKQAQDWYHSKKGPKGYKPITDEQYEALLRLLKKEVPDDPLLSKVGAKPGRGIKVSLPRSMLSLPKVRIGEPGFTKWLAKNPGPLDVSDKLDGVSLEYGRNATSYYLYTRGDGTTGTDVSHLIPYVNGLGKLSVNQAVRGEMVITKADFVALSKKYENARNLASGIVNKSGIHSVAKIAQFLVHAQTQPAKMLSTVAGKLKTAGFKIVHYKTFARPTEKALTAYLQDRMANAPVDLDGVVMTSKNGSMALKGITEEATATIKEIEWNISRHGLLKPTAIFSKPVRLAGVSVSRATANNARQVQTQKLGPGAVVTIIRSGEVIPKITGVVTPARVAQMPLKGTYEWSGEADISSLEESDDQTSKVMSHFLITLGIKSFKSNMMKKLIDSGMDTVIKLLKATPARFEAAGFGKKQAQTLYDEIRDALPKMGHARMMVASGVFPSGFGVRRMTAIVTPLESKLFKEPVRPAAIKKMILGLSGMGERIAEDFSVNFPAYLSFLDKIGWTPTKPKVSKVKIAQTLDGYHFAFTKYRDAKMEQAILDRGGTVGSVKRGTKSYLITNDPNGSSVKLDKAAEYGVRILNPLQAQKIVYKK